jgi:hypothetical protein
MRAFEKLYEQHGMKGVSAAAVAKEAGYRLPEKPAKR